MLGALREALDEATAAVEELKGFCPVHAGAAQHELGEIRLRLGDLDAADEAFRRAHDQGEDPQPGLALLRLTQGTRRGVVVDPAEPRAGGVRPLHAGAVAPAYAEIAVEDCDAASARQRPASSPTSPSGSGRRRSGRRAGGRTGSSRRSQATTQKRPCTSAGRATDGATSARRSRRRRRRPRWPRRCCFGRPRGRRRRARVRACDVRTDRRAAPRRADRRGRSPRSDRTVARPVRSCSPTSSDRPR